MLVPFMHLSFGSWFFVFYFPFIFNTQLDIALIKNNARVGSRVALALNKIQKVQGRRDGPSPSGKVFSAPRPVSVFLPCEGCHLS